MVTLILCHLSPVRLRTIPWKQWPEWSAVWSELAAACRHDSVFLSAPWIRTWLAVYGEELAPELIFFREGEVVTGGCVLVRRQRAHGVPLRSVYLNCAGEDDADSTYIEYNALVARPESEERVAEALAAHVQSLGWDRFMIAGAVPQPALDRLAGLLGQFETDSRPCHYVDLARLRREGMPYAKAVSGKTRKENNFTRRAFEQTYGGACVMEQAASSTEAEQYFRQLGELHNASWQARDKAGMFTSAKFLAFHSRLISELLGEGQILLLRLRAGDTVLAVLYCLLYKRRAYFYQSGLRYSEDKRLRPGFLALTLAIEHLYPREDIDEFDFLAGDDQYKKSLSTDVRELRWTTVWAPSISSGAFRALKYIKGAIESHVG